jgi:hypothetical protein
MIKKILSGLFFCLLASSVFAGQGWYLLQPGGSKAFPAHTLTTTPLRGWDHHSSYDTAEGCEQRKRQALDWGKKGLAKAHQDAKEANTEEQRSEIMEWVEFLSLWRLSRCIASDDPRLK